VAKRDSALNVLVITGAGASANLGVDDTALPMMGGWADDLIPRLGYAAGQLGLAPNTDGPTFEQIIGRFLNSSRSLPAVEALGFMGEMTNLLGNTPGSSGGNFLAWQSTARTNIESLNQQLWESLWRNFGRRRVDGKKAGAAYGALHDLIRESRGEDGSPCYIAHVTTNFDPAIEMAIGVSTYPSTEPLDGFAASTGYGRPRWAPNLLTTGRANSDGRIPVVHIHGAVGWYFDPDDENVIQRRPSDDDFDPRLSPALLLPDDTKRPDLFPVPLIQVWEQFQILLREATHVFVMGHSLHDTYLVNAIKDAAKPTAVMSLGSRITSESTVAEERKNRLAAAKLGDQGSAKDALAYILEGQWVLRDRSEADRIRQAIPDAVVIPGAFGSGEPGGDFDTAAFTKWIDRN
jgi:hypothetical protein